MTRVNASISGLGHFLFKRSQHFVQDTAYLSVEFPKAQTVHTSSTGRVCEHQQEIRCGMGWMWGAGGRGDLR